MNVLLINSSDGCGGAAIAALRLHQGLLSQGIEAHFLVGNCQNPSQYIAAIPRNYRIETLIGRLTRRCGFNDFNSISTFDIPQHSFYQSADILNFHNLHGGYFNYLALSKLTEQKPAILTLHDMWSFTGHCVYSFDCNRWKTGCGNCPYPNTYPAIQWDSTAIEWRLKQKAFSHANLAIVTLSNWLTKQVQQSFLNHLPIHYIPNGIDTTIYRPLDQKQCRAILGIPEGKRVLMFAAQNLLDPRKGSDLLFQALQSLPGNLRAEIVLLTIGSEQIQIAQTFEMTTYHLGYVSSDRLKAIIYSAADLFVFPTRADNLPIVLQESMACGTPMVSFKIGGVPDLVRPNITGYLAEPENALDLGKGIFELLENHSLLNSMRQRCREVALSEYSIQLQVQRYIYLYQQFISTALEH